MKQYVPYLLLFVWPVVTALANAGIAKLQARHTWWGTLLARIGADVVGELEKEKNGVAP